MQQVKWFERTFDFSFTQNIFPSIIERLAGTPARLEEKLSLVDPRIVSISTDGSWTIKENIGHLTDLEPLWQERFEDIREGAAELRPADLQNTKTVLAGHNNTPTEKLLHDFRQARANTIKLLENLPEGLVFKSALHPRLKTPMRTIDLFLFVAEHDDHHLAHISAIAKGLHLNK